MTVGIYKLNFPNTDKVYVGKSKHIEIRFKEHMYTFKDRSMSKKLLSGFLEFGIPTLEILCECTIEELNDLETEAIEIFNSVNNGFNSLASATDMPEPLTWGANNGMSKHTNEQIIQVFHILVDTPDKTVKTISKETQVSENTVHQIATATRHSWLKELFPEKYNILLASRGKRNKTAINRSAKALGIVYPEIKSPLGEIFSVENVNKFCREHSLHTGCLCRLLNYKAKSHKGWTLA